jgi:dethiobiotin synthetase
MEERGPARSGGVILARNKAIHARETNREETGGAKIAGSKKARGAPNVTAMKNIIFITGTDTGVGKTVLTSLLTRFLRDEGCDALAMKPFCSGSRGDARLLRAAGDDLLTLDEINPFYFEKPVAPAADGGRGKIVSLDTVMGKIRAVSDRCDVLLVEGSGGLLVPLGKNYTIADVIAGLGCPALVVSRNRLGTISHTLLTVRVMESVGIKEIGIVVMEAGRPDISSRNNLRFIREMASSRPVFSVPNLGKKASNTREMKNNAKKMKKVLAPITGDAIFNLVLRDSPKKQKKIVQQNPLTTGFGSSRLTKP